MCQFLTLQLPSRARLERIWCPWAVLLSRIKLSVCHPSGPPPSRFFHPLQVLASNPSANFIDGPMVGTMGLSISTLSYTGSVPFWQILASSGQLDSSDMGFFLDRSTSKSDVPGGVFTLGGTNSSLYSGNVEFTNLAVNEPNLWLVAMTGQFFSFLHAGEYRSLLLPVTERMLKLSLQLGSTRSDGPRPQSPPDLRSTLVLRDRHREHPHWRVQTRCQGLLRRHSRSR